MAKRTIHQLIDDLTGEEADETVSFGLDGKEYEIDLAEDNAAALREIMAPYLAAGTRVGGKRPMRLSQDARPTKQIPPPAKVGGEYRRTELKMSGVALTLYNRKVRAWAIAEGLDISDRGRIAQGIVDQYEAAQAAKGASGNGKVPAGTVTRKSELAPQFATPEPAPAPAPPAPTQTLRRRAATAKAAGPVSRIARRAAGRKG